MLSLQPPPPTAPEYQFYYQVEPQPGPSSAMPSLRPTQVSFNEDHPKVILRGMWQAKPGIQFTDRFPAPLYPDV